MRNLVFVVCNLALLLAPLPAEAGATPAVDRQAVRAVAPSDWFQVDTNTLFGGDSFNSHPDGRAKLDLRVRFESKRRLGLDIWELRDWCSDWWDGQDDGKGAFVSMYVYLKSTVDDDGSGFPPPVYLREVPLTSFTGPCPGFAYDYDVTWSPADLDDTYKVVNVQFLLRECAKSSPHVCSHNRDRDWADSRIIDNPKVGMS